MNPPVEILVTTSLTYAENAKDGDDTSSVLSERTIVAYTRDEWGYVEVGTSEQVKVR